MRCCFLLLMVGAVVVLGVELEKVEVDTRGEPPACCRLLNISHQQTPTQTQYQAPQKAT